MCFSLPESLHEEESPPPEEECAAAASEAASRSLVAGKWCWLVGRDVGQCMLHFFDAGARADPHHAALTLSQGAHGGTFQSITIAIRAPPCGSL